MPMPLEYVRLQQYRGRSREDGVGTKSAAVSTGLRLGHGHEIAATRTQTSRQPLVFSIRTPTNSFCRLDSKQEAV